MKHYRLNFIALISCIASAQGELPKLVRAEDSLKIEPRVLRVQTEPKATTISWEEKGTVMVRITNVHGVIVREMQAEGSVTWDATWPAKNPKTNEFLVTEDGPYEIRVRKDGKLIGRGTVYVDNAGEAPNSLLLFSRRRFPRWKEERTPDCKTEEHAEFLHKLQYGVDAAFHWWWGVSKDKDGQFVWDADGKGKMHRRALDPAMDYSAGCYFLGGRFIFQVARDFRFKKIVHQSRWRMKPWGITVPLKPGKYLYRIIGMDEHGRPVMKKKESKTGKIIDYTSQVVPFEVAPLRSHKRRVNFAKVTNMSRAEFEKFAFDPQEVESWGPPIAQLATSRWKADEHRYWHGEEMATKKPVARWKTGRSMLAAKRSRDRRIGAFETTLSEQVYYPEEMLITMYRLYTDADIDANIKSFRPPRETFFQYDYGNYYEYVKTRGLQGFDDSEEVLRLGLQAGDAKKLSIRVEIISRETGKRLIRAKKLPAVVTSKTKLPKKFQHCEVADGQTLSAFKDVIGFEVDISGLPLAMAGTQQYEIRSTLLKSGKKLHTLSRFFGRAERPILYRMPWGKIEINDDRSLYINGRPVFLHSIHRGHPRTTRLHGFNANFANVGTNAKSEKFQTAQIEDEKWKDATKRKVMKWMIHEPIFDRSYTFMQEAKKVKPADNIMALSTTIGGWVGESKVFDFWAAHGTNFKVPVVVMPYHHVGGPELTGFFIDTGAVRARRLEEMGVPAFIYTEGGIYRIRPRLMPHGIGEITANLYTAIIHGCRGYDWFGEYSWENYGAAADLHPEQYSHLYRILGAQINWLQPILCAGKVEQDASIWPNTAEILKKQHDGKTYLFACRWGPGRTVGEWKWAKLGEQDAHYHDPAEGYNLHSIYFGPNTALKEDSVIRQQVYIDPANPPKSIGLHFVNRKLYASKWFCTEDWEHTAFWGDAGKINIGLKVEEDTPHPSHVPMGELPAAGQWVTLEVPIKKLGLRHDYQDDGWNICGAAFGTLGGRVFWGATTVTTESGKEISYITKDAIDHCTSDSETMKVSVPGLEAGKKINVPFEGRTLKAKEGYFEDEFDKDDYSTHIYEIAP